jgi:hypothetical protein
MENSYTVKTYRHKKVNVARNDALKQFVNLFNILTMYSPAPAYFKFAEDIAGYFSEYNEQLLVSGDKIAVKKDTARKRFLGLFNMLVYFDKSSVLFDCASDILTQINGYKTILVKA